MHGTASLFVLTRVILLLSWKCLVFAAPFIALAALWWLVNQTERMIHFFFPDLEWEKSLGWLDLRTERRVNAALRWIGYGIDVLLAVALLGIVWAAEGLRNLGNWPDPWVMGDLALRVPVLGICLGAWLLFLGGWLLPKLRAEREEAGLRKFRREMAEAEMEREAEPRSRVHAPLRKPRVNPPAAPIAAGTRRRR
jgi:hypothetical protein